MTLAWRNPDPPARSEPPAPGEVRLERMTKAFYTDGRRRIVADGIDAVFPAGRAVALLGRNGAGKSTLLRVISGGLLPTSGRVVAGGRVSWPVGLSKAFHGELTGLQNLRFVARVYGRDVRTLEAFVREFSGLGPALLDPVRTYSSGMRGRLAFALSMGIPFDCYLIDEVTAVGDLSFKALCQATLRDRLSASSAIIVSHNPEFLARTCDAAVILEAGRLTWFEDVAAAARAYRRMLGV